MSSGHYEDQYLDLIRRVWTEGDERVDRTGVGTRALFGAQLRFDLSDDAVPLLTTKRVFWKTAARERLRFLTGDTNIRPLVPQGVKIWSDWPHARYRRESGDDMTLEEFEARVRDDADFAVQWGDLGPVYGAQWVRWPSFVGDDTVGYRRGAGINQLAQIVTSLRENPGSRRHILTGWNVADLDAMALPPCHMTYQFHVSGGNRLSCLLFQRSCDLGLGFAFNVFEATMLTRMLAQQCDLVAHELIWSGGDVHLYLNHADLVEEQLQRTPEGAPKLRIGRRPPTLFDYRIEDFTVDDYAPQGAIRAPVAV